MHRRGALLAGGGAVSIMVLTQLLALWLLAPFEAAGYRAVDDPSNPAYGAVFVLVVLVATAGLLLALKYDLQALIRGGIILVAGLLSWYVLAAVSPASIAVDLGPFAIDPVAILGVVAIVLGLLYYPEWYVIDASAIVIGAGATALFGLSFSILPIVILLVVLAVYDAVSVYGTKHMLTLAEGAMSMRLPVLLVIPTSWHFSTLDIDERLEQEPEDEAEATGMDAVFLGLGDVVIPSILIASAATHGLGTGVVSIGDLAIGWPVIGGIIGSLAGLSLLIGMVLRGSPHAGLPLLNGGVILGYLLGAVLA
ncbi:MAG: presenilin family intramembrane aspartyl protease PSH, partial [Halobacteriota archaeon]